MFSRILGVLLVLRWVAPLIIGAAVVLIAYHVFVDAGRVAQEPLRLIEESAKSLKVLVATSDTQLKQIESDAHEISQAAERLPTVDLTIPISLSLPDIKVPDIKVNVPVVTTGTRKIPPPTLDVTLPTISVSEKEVGFTIVGKFYGVKVPDPHVGTRVDKLAFPSFDVPTIAVSTEKEDLVIPDIPGLSIPLPEPFPAIGQTLSDIRDVVISISGTMEDVTGMAATLATAKQDLEAIEKEAEALKTETALVARTWAKPVFWVLLASGIALVLSYVVTTIDNLRHSWRLITGKGG